MNKGNYSFVMMDADAFEKYQKHCKRDGVPVNYNRIGTDCYGVMIRNERSKEDEIKAKRVTKKKEVI